MNTPKKTSPITVVYGNTPDRMTELLLSTVSLASRIPQGASIGIKPNLVVARPASQGATTTPEIVEGIIRHLQDHGHTRISVLESAWVGDSTKRAYRNCGYEDISRKYNVPLIDLKDDDSVTIQAENRSYDICAAMQGIDFLINVPVLKGHCQTVMTGALKNLKGCIPDSEKRRYHSLGLHRPIADLNRIIRQDWIIMDALCGDLSFEEGGDPSTMHRIISAEDPVLLDSYCCTLLGVTPRQVPYIQKAADLGVGKLYDGDEVLELNNPDDSYHIPRMHRSFEHLVDQRDACSACYGALVRALMETDDQLFDQLQQLSRKLDAPAAAVGQAFNTGAWPFSRTLGIGSCTSSADMFVKGCPPTAEIIKKGIREFLGQQ